MLNSGRPSLQDDLFALLLVLESGAHFPRRSPPRSARSRPQSCLRTRTPACAFGEWPVADSLVCLLPARCSFFLSKLLLPSLETTCRPARSVAKQGLACARWTRGASPRHSRGVRRPMPAQFQTAGSAGKRQDLQESAGQRLQFQAQSAASIVQIECDTAFDWIGLATWRMQRARAHSDAKSERTL